MNTMTQTNQAVEAAYIRVVEKANCFVVHEGNEVAGSFTGPECKERAALFATALRVELTRPLEVAEVELSDEQITDISAAVYCGLDREVDDFPIKFARAILAASRVTAPAVQPGPGPSHLAVAETKGAQGAEPEGLDPYTKNLVVCFANALENKLFAAQKKYGYAHGWMSKDWMDECRDELRKHIAKGDPRDVAAYCAFLWHHGESTAAPNPVTEAAHGIAPTTAKDEQ